MWNPTMLTDADRRWMVHILAALREHIHDEFEVETLPYHDPATLEDRDKFEGMMELVYDNLTTLMHNRHREEAALVAQALARPSR